MKINAPNRPLHRVLALIAGLFSLFTAAFAQTGTWVNPSGGSWTTAANWSGGTIATNAGNTADFSTLTLGSAPTVTLDGARSIGHLTFGDVGNTYGWTLDAGSGGPLTLAVSSGAPLLTVNNQTTTIGLGLVGTNGLTKMGAGTVTFLGTNTYSGATLISNGVANYNGASSSSGGGIFNVGGTAGRAVVNINTTGTITQNGAYYGIGGTQPDTTDTGAGVLNLIAGTLNHGNNNNYTEIGTGGLNGGGTYGCFNLSGGTFNTVGSSGIRVGAGGIGVFHQTGGVLNATRWFAVGSQANGGATANAGGIGLVNFLGGTATIAAANRIILSDKSGGTAILNLGTEAGGTATVASLNSSTTQGGVDFVDSGGTGARAILNLNSGTLRLAGPMYRNNSAGTAQINWNGATLQANASGNMIVTNNGLNTITVYNGGVVIDSQANTTTNAARLTKAGGNGVYPVGGTITIPTGNGAGYLGIPYVTVTNTGTGSGAMAIANLSGRAVSSVTLTCPGQNYVVGDVVGFVFSGGGATTPATPYVYTLTANDLSPNALGGVVKNGSGTLALISSNNTHTGNTTVNAGTLLVTADGGLGLGNVVVSNGAALTLGGSTTNGYIAATANLVLGASATANLNFAGTTTVNGLSLDGGITYVAVGTYGSSSSPAVNQDNIHFTGTGVINVTATPAGATVALTSSLNPSEFSQSVTFTATVSGSSAPPTGTLTFKDGSVPLATVSLDSGVATYTTTALPSGSHALSAIYNGNGTYSSATSPTLTQVVNPRNAVWTGAVNDVWDINTTPNWLALGTAANYHDNDQAWFDDTATGSTDVALNVAVKPYSVVVSNATRSYTLSGTGTIGGSASLTKAGAGTLTVSNANSYTGLTAVNNGTLNFTGASASSGNGVLNVGNGSGTGVVNIASSGTFAFTGVTSLGGIAGNSSDTGSGVINQSNGTVNLGANSTYLELGAGDGDGTPRTYGCYNLAGGTLNTINASGVRVGASGFGVFRQTGGTLNCSRYFAVGTHTGSGNGSGEATFLGGLATVSSSFRIIVGDVLNGTGVLNLGSQGGGNARLAALYNSGGNCLQLANNGATGVLNLNSGTLQMAGAIYGAGNLNLNGGTLQALTNASLIDTTLGSVNLYNGGVTIDSQGYTVTNAAAVQLTYGNGIYPAGGSIAVTSGGGSGYIGAPLVTVSGGSGFGATAIANLSGDVVTSVTLTCPGQNYQAGDSVSFTFSGGGTATPASPFSYTLQAADLAANGIGGLTKVGTGTLTLTGNSSYTGPTVVKDGTLVISTDATGSGAYLVTNGSTLNVRFSYPGAQLGMSSLSFGGPAINTLGLDFTAAGALSSAPLNVSGNLNVTGLTTINLFVGGLSIGRYPLIQYGGSLTGTGTFTLGALPIGVVARLVTNTVAMPNSIDLVVTSSGQPRWEGQVAGVQNGNWDINTTPNWIDALTSQTAPYKEGQPVLFDDTATGTTTVNLIANVHPGSVTFNNNGLNYTLNGPSKISGTIALTVQGAAGVIINALNDYTGPTIVAGPLTVNSLADAGSPSPLGAGSLVLSNNGTLTYSGPAVAIDRSFTVTDGGGSLTLNGNLTLSGQVASANGAPFTKSGPSTLTYSGAVTNQFGSNTIAAGTVVFDGSAGAQSNVVSGSMMLGSLGSTAGSLVLTNSSLNVSRVIAVDNGTALVAGNSVLQNNGAFLLGDAAGLGVLNYNSSGASVLGGDGSSVRIGGNSGASDSGVGAINQIAGAMTCFPVGTGLYLELGSGGNNPYGSYTLSGTGSLTSSGGIRIGAGGLGVFTQTGGTLSCGRYLALGTISGGLTAGGQGVATFSGGSATISSGFTIILGDKPGSAGVLNLGTLAGGTVTLATSGGVRFLADNSAGSGVLNLNRGTLQLSGSITRNTANTTGTGLLNLNGGILQAGANNLTLIDTTFNAANVYNGGVVVDSQTNAATISAGLLATAGSGIYTPGGSFAIAANGGSGYIGAPIVTVSGGSGSGATAIANLSGGVVTSVTLTCPGQGYVAGDTLNFDFSGGGTVTPAGTFTHTLAAGELAANATGGLAKIGSGTLTLSGTNSYSGATVVSNGTLFVNGSLLGGGAVTVDGGNLGGNGLITSAVIVNSNATLAAGTSSIGWLSISNTLTFKTGATNFARLNKTAGTNDSVRGLTQVNYAGTLVVTNLAGTLAAGDKFTLFSASTRTGSFTTLVLPTLPAGLGWSNSLAIDGSIQVVTTVNSTPTSFTVAVSGTNLNLSWPADHTGWRLVVQTNNLAAGISLNPNDWATVSGSASTNQVFLPIDPAKPTEFYRLVYP